jgi:hypothetical protein
LRHGDAERLRGLQVDQQFDLGDLLDRQVGRLLALEDALKRKPSVLTNRASTGCVSRVPKAPSISSTVLTFINVEGYRGYHDREMVTR